MSRFARKVDTTHAEIGHALRQIGASVHDTSRLGDDFPDYVVGWKKRTFMVECKSPNRAGGQHAELPRERSQREARESWLGDWWIVAVTGPDAVLQLVQAVTVPRRHEAAS